MFNNLIRFLGGFTKSEYTFIELQYNNQRELVSTYRAREDELKKQLVEEKAERQRLQEIIFKKFNILPEESQTFQEQEQFQPINTSPRRWSNLRTAMEQDDHNRVKYLINDFKESRANA